MKQGIGAGIGNRPMTPQELHAAIPQQQAVHRSASLQDASVSVRKEVVEGDVVISFPENLSAQSFEDLKDHLDLFIRKIQRRAVPNQIAPGQAPQISRATESQSSAQVPRRGLFEKWGISMRL